MPPLNQFNPYNQQRPANQQGPFSQSASRLGYQTSPSGANLGDQKIVPWATLVIAAISFLLSMGIWIGLEFGYKPFLQAIINDTDSKNTALVKQFNESKDRVEVVRFYSQTVNAKKLIANHVIASPAFDLIEKDTLPETSYKEFSMNRDEKNKTVSVSLNGSTKSYDTLASQLALYSSDVNVLKVAPGGASSGENDIQFSASLSLNPQIFKFSKKVNVIVPPVK